MANLSFPQKMSKAKERLKSNEQMLGSGLQQPFSNTNSGSRKLMAATQRTHALGLLHGEKAIIETGFEIQFGEHSSSIAISDSDYEIIGKISKFSFAPNHHYWLLLRNLQKNEIKVIERVSYKHITESYAYLYNNNVLDSLSPGGYIQAGTMLKKSLAFDDFNNRQDGVNLSTAYLALDANMEDSEIISDVAAKKMVAPLIKLVKIMINENDIPLNLYGNDSKYQVIPDIGQEINPDNGILIGLRKEKKEEALFMQSAERLKNPLMSDDKYFLQGRVVDLNIYCNNPENLNGTYNAQFKMYHDELMRQSREFVALLTPYIAQGFKMEYQLQKLFGLSKRIINGDKYMEKRLFSNIELEIYVLEELPLNVGDKISNRYGGKGVISDIRPQHLMPQNPITGEYVDVILNSSTMYNRENPGQLFEISLNHISSELCRQIATGVYSSREAFDIIVSFIECCAPSQYETLKEWGSHLSEDDLKFFVESVVDDGAIQISSLPMSESINIDKLNYIYQKFPGIKTYKFKVPLKSSTGDIRYIETRRPLVVGKQYMFRLKQYAEEKFSSTSLSATNIRNENIKSKASRDYREMYSNTPIRAGSMEIDNMNHIGAEYVISVLMLHSLSPHGRRLVESFYTGDPYTVDIKLDQDSSNRSAEIVNAYLKTIGLRLKFVKVKKHKVNALKFHALSFSQDAKKPALFFNKEKDFDFQKDFEEKSARENNPKKNAIHFNAIKFFDNPPEN